MNMNENKYGYQEPIIKDGDYLHGDGKLGTIAINPSGDWSQYLPDPELQNRGYETFSCVSESTLHCTEILQRKKYTDSTKYSVRFLATMSGTGPAQGNDGGTVAETLRKGGCCQETDWPFTAANYDAFYTRPPQNIIELAAYQFRDNSFGHSWITDTTPQGMMNALTFSPLALGVYAWPQPDAQGIYHRPEGAKDCHDVTVFNYVENQYWLIFDSYDTTIKKLAWGYGFGVGKRFTLDRRIPTSPTPDNTGWVHWDIWIDAVRRFLHLGEYSYGRTFGAVRSPQWPGVRAAHLLKEPECQLCGGTTSLQVHHIRPFHIHPELELEDSNLITLCTGNNTINCHVRFGHLDNFKDKWNPNIRENCQEWSRLFNAKTEHEIFPDEQETSV